METPRPNVFERIKDIRPSTLAIGAIALGVGLYDYYCPEGEQISERCDEFVNDPIKNIALNAVVLAVGLHLTNRISERADFLHLLGSFKSKSSRHAT